MAGGAEVVDGADVIHQGGLGFPDGQRGKGLAWFSARGS
jgi:hypothetical protein